MITATPTKTRKTHQTRTTRSRECHERIAAQLKRLNRVNDAAYMTWIERFIDASLVVWAQKNVKRARQGTRSVR